MTDLSKTQEAAALHFPTPEELMRIQVKNLEPAVHNLRERIRGEMENSLPSSVEILVKLERRDSGGVLGIVQVELAESGWLTRLETSDDIVYLALSPGAKDGMPVELDSDYLYTTEG